MAQEKICLISGANSGIGYGLADGMARKGYRIVMLCRNEQKGAAARQKLIQETGNEQIDLMIADLASQRSIRAFAKRFIDQYGHLDVLFNNAGTTFFNYELTEDGIERSLAVNYLSHFLLTNLLLPVLKAAPSARIITTAGAYHTKVKELDINNLDLKGGYSGMKTGSLAMLLRIMFTLELNRRLRKEGIAAHSFHPGAVRTNLTSHLPWHLKLLVAPMRLFFSSPQKGASTGVFLATSEEVSGKTGLYYHKMTQCKASDLAHDPQLATQLWEKSEELVKRSSQTPTNTI